MRILQRADGLRNEQQKITEKFDKLVLKITELLGVPVNVMPAVAGQLSNIQKLALQVQGNRREDLPAAEGRRSGSRRD
jgi:hypothetical protein